MTSSSTSAPELGHISRFDGERTVRRPAGRGAVTTLGGLVKFTRIMLGLPAIRVDGSPLVAKSGPAA